MRLFATLFVATTVILLAGTSLAAIPGVVEYQGRLLESGGSPVADGNHVVLFEIFDVAAGGSSLWSSGNRTVQTADGLFNYPLGDSSAFPSGLFASNPDLYLEITIVGDPPLSPRTKLESVPYAFFAEGAQEVANEPGVTQFINDTGDDLVNGFLVEFALDSVLAPAAGVVLCQATFSVSVNHLAGDVAGAAFLIVDSSFSLGTSQENYFVIDSTYADGTFEVPVHIHRIMEVVPGWNRFSVIGADFIDPGQTISVRRVTFTMTYFDRAYNVLQYSEPPSASTDRNVTPIDDATRQRWQNRLKGSDW